MMKRVLVHTLSTHAQPSDTCLSRVATDVFFSATASGHAARNFACSAMSTVNASSVA